MYWRAYSTTGCGAVERPDRAREDRRGQLRQPRLLGGQLDQVVVRAGLPDQLAEVGDRRAARRPRAGAARGRTARAASWPASTRRTSSVEVVERRAQVHERRVGLAQRARQQLERALERRRSRRRSRPSPGSCWPPGRPGRRGARRSPTRCRRRPARSASAPAWSSASSLRRARELLDRNGAKYFGALARLRAARVVPVAGSRGSRSGGRARVLASSVLNSTSRSTGAEVSSAPMCPPSAIFVARFGPGLERDVAVRDARQRGGADRRRGALVERRDVVVDLHRHDGVRLVVQLDRR